MPEEKREEKNQEKKEVKNKEALKIFNGQEKENELLLESQKIATNGIKDLFKIAAIAIKGTDPAEIKRCMLSLSHIATTVKEAAAATITQDQPVQNQSTSQRENSNSTRNMSCLFCFKPHYVIDCPKIPNQYKGYCVNCWKTMNHQAKHCKSNKRKPPWVL